MKAPARFELLLAIGLGLAVGACATAPPKPEVAPAPVVVTPPPPPLPPPPPPSKLPALLEERVAPHRLKAQVFEREGDLRSALEELKVALTINPDDPLAQEGRKRLEARIEQGVAEQIKLGREALRRGVHPEARRYFLAALALDPSNKTTFEALQTEVKEVRFVTHTVRKGETLGTIAERYYGDRSRLEVIWEVNQLPPNPKLAVGTALKIPEIPGVPFLIPEARKEAPRPRPEVPSATAPKEEPAKPEEVVQEVNPVLAEAKEAFDKGEYMVALADADKLLASNPRNPEAIDLKKAALYRHGKSQLDQKKFDDSYRALTQLAKLDPNYQDTGALLKQARVRLILAHYNEGIRLYREENLEGAIAEWRTVLEYEPNHAEAKKNIEQAERLLKTLEQRQQKKKP